MICRARGRLRVSEGPLLGSDVQGWAPTVSLSPMVTPWDISGALVMLFTKYEDPCPKAESRETALY